MALKSKIKQSELKEWLKNGVEKELHNRIVRNLNYLGFQCVSIARKSQEYQDQTSNLRNSTGYIILKDGEVIDSWFEVGRTGKEDGKLGAKKGKEHAEKVGQQYKQGYALIVVAGMEYAGYVQDVHNRDVLKSAEHFAKSKAEDIMKNIIAKFE